MNTPFTFKHTQPANMDPTKKYPAIFLLHGMGSNEDDLPQLVQDFQDQCHIISLKMVLLHKSRVLPFSRYRKWESQTVLFLIKC
ncbi:hypothetical protein LSPH26S_03121 [Lysinibacillus sphaericus]